jgi:hypothetical protein
MYGLDPHPVTTTCDEELLLQALLAERTSNWNRCRRLGLTDDEIAQRVGSTLPPPADD